MKCYDELLNHGMLAIRLLREIMLKDQAKWGDVLYAAVWRAMLRRRPS